MENKKSIKKFRTFAWEFRVVSGDTIKVVPSFVVAFLIAFVLVASIPVVLVIIYLNNSRHDWALDILIGGNVGAVIGAALAMFMIRRQSYTINSQGIFGRTPLRFKFEIPWERIERIQTLHVLRFEKDIEYFQFFDKYFNQRLKIRKFPEIIPIIEHHKNNHNIKGDEPEIEDDSDMDPYEAVPIILESLKKISERIDAIEKKISKTKT